METQKLHFLSCRKAKRAAIIVILFTLFYKEPLVNNNLMRYKLLNKTAFVQTPCMNILGIAALHHVNFI